MRTALIPALIVTTAACFATAQADHMSPWGAGWANMPNDIHNTRLDTRGDTEAFLDFIQFGEGADSVNRFLVEEVTTLEAELTEGHQVDQLSARLDPLDGFLGGGWARYTAFDGDTAVTNVLNISVRLRLIRANGAVANEALTGLPEYAADPATTVQAYFRTYGGTDYAACGLVYEDLIIGDDGTAEYAVYGLSLKLDQTGLIEGTGSCAAVDPDGVVLTDSELLPAVQSTDVVDIAVRTPVMDAEVVALMGGF